MPIISSLQGESCWLCDTETSIFVSVQICVSVWVYMHADECILCACMYTYIVCVICACIYACICYMHAYVLRVVYMCRYMHYMYVCICVYMSINICCMHAYVCILFVYMSIHCQHPLDHRKSKRVPEIHVFCFIDYAKNF